MTHNNSQNQFSIFSLIALHLIPGVIILLLSILFSNPSFGMGLPMFLSLTLAILFGLIPSELGIMIFFAKREGKKLGEVIAFTEKMSLSKTVLWVVPLFIISALAFSLFQNIEGPLWTIFSWFPEWFKLEGFFTRNFSNNMLYITIVFGFIFNGFLGPFVEELYFRGFLLPRMNKLGKWAPFLNVVLFSIYHFFTPWQNITRILAITPYVYGVWYNKNIRIGILVHCTLNTCGMIIQAIQL